MEEKASSTPPVDTLGAVIRQHRQRLEEMLARSLGVIASRCASVWGDSRSLDGELRTQLEAIPCCLLLYAIDTRGVQYSGNISKAGIDVDARGQNLSGRPYLSGYANGQTFILSDVYISRVGRRSCVTALHRVCSESGDILGYLAADFDLRNLPQLHKAAEMPIAWRQIKGDPVIRQALFYQQRISSVMDAYLNQVHDIIHELITECGVFHAKLHYGSSRATLWLNNDPRHYRIHVLDEIIDPSVCLTYPRMDYPIDAIVTPQQVRETLDRFVNLRLGDSVIYLRSASVNVINGMVGVNFSCDGTHYVPVPEFLEKGHQFWFGG